MHLRCKGVEKDSVTVGFLHNNGKIHLVKMPVESLVPAAKYEPGQDVMMNHLVDKYPLPPFHYQCG